MITEFAARFQEIRQDLWNNLAEKRTDPHYWSYESILKLTIETMFTGDYNSWGSPDPNRITKIDEGDYQGTLVFVIGQTGYQPATYWATKVSYGSCSGCDTLQAIEEDTQDVAGSDWEQELTDQAINDLCTLALHMIQNMKEI